MAGHKKQQITPERTEHNKQGLNSWRKHHAQLRGKSKNKNLSIPLTPGNILVVYVDAASALHTMQGSITVDASKQSMLQRIGELSVHLTDQLEKLGMYMHKNDRKVQ